MIFQKSPKFLVRIINISIFNAEVKGFLVWVKEYVDDIIRHTAAIFNHIYITIDNNSCAKR